MKLNELSPAPGSVKKSFRVGRGNGSGAGKTAGKGHKGQRRIPKRGFVNIFATRYEAINVDQLNRFEDGSVVDEAAIVGAGLVKNTRDGIKILGRGELTKRLTVKVAAFSEGAKSKIEAAGGKAEVV